ncbi:DUF1292 domain-containing protein [Peptoniphilus sp. KCTC 25270]|uniref:DUF1292 domain-containing protein n=1 Tax=Peptoniphilus sp. KCTC 25270 TaxID=2897414 RepID=UPI001E5C0030|nr:DUF1292 domain-containing protein [Peptoniphilus sp. KCTC 25270]MCD1147173.1 DUF1292 domain-containing protein [Peptoniphilus sp. KCTC 25270]
MERHLFYDEMGNEVEFIIKAQFSVGDIDYVAMMPAEDLEADTYILRIDYDENGEAFLAGVGEEELKVAVEVYEELLKENLQ